MTIEITIGVLAAAFGMLVGYLGFQRNRDTDVRSDATESAVVRTKLDAIGSGVDSIRVDMRVSDRRHADLSERVIRVEESVKQAHKRLDTNEERGGTNS